jgi:hypothetical protein
MNLKRTLTDRFWEKVDVPFGATDEDCWEWTAGTTKLGYGRINVNGESKYATHVAWFLKHGSWPVLPILHKCDYPQCINPSHLFEGTRSDNHRDMCSKGRHWNQKKTHCIHGHPLFGDNLYIKPDGKRTCRKCVSESVKKYQKRKLL